MSEKYKELTQSEIPVLIDFFASWCQPCKVQSSVLNSVKEKVKTNARIIKIDIDQYPQIAKNENVMSVPTLIIYKKGQMLWRGSGIHDVNTLTQLLNQAIEN